MKCPKCSTENSQGLTFCEQCGAKLERVCLKCNFSNPADFKYCGKCGNTLEELQVAPPIDYSKPKSYTPKFLADKILTTRTSIEGERKLVTVLFADVANYTSISGKLDPEDVHQIMNGCFRILMDEIHKYEGTINQFTGDGVMAIFGAPIAHEDHAQKACYAALEIQKALKNYNKELKARFGINFQMRMGLNSGSVVVGSIGDDLRMDYTAEGDTTNLASRMEGLAEPGAIYVTEETFKLTGGLFEFEALGERKVKGKDKPVLVYKVLSAKDVYRPRLGSERIIYSEMVGRDSELEELKGRVWNAITGQGSVVNIIGEAGIGKSRLVAELKKWEELKKLEDKKKVVLWEGRAISIGRNLSFHPITDLLKQWIGIRQDDNQVTALSKLQNALRNLFLEEVGEVLPFVATLMGIPLSGKYAERVKGLEGEVLQKLILKSLRDLLIRAAERIPLVIIMEDLHWADTSTLELLESLFGLAETQRILFINLFRPGFLETGDRIVKTVKEKYVAHSVEMRLERLDDLASKQLISNMLSIC